MTLVGHDWGSFLSFLVESQRPDLIESLVALDVGSTLKITSIRQALFIVSYQWWLVLAYGVGHVSDKAGTAMTHWICRQIRTPQPEASRWQMNYLYAWFWRLLLTGRRPQIRTTSPLMFIYGKKKPVMFHTQDWLDRVNQDKKNKTVCLENAGHWFMKEDPEAVNGHLDQWLRQRAAQI